MAGIVKLGGAPRRRSGGVASFAPMGAVIRHTPQRRRAASRMAIRAALRAFAVLAVMAGGLASPAQSEAGSYTVHICDGASGNQVHSVGFGSNGANEAYPSCPTDGSGHRIGFVTRSAINGGTTGWLTGGWATFSAPGGTTIGSVSGHLAGRGVQGYGSSLQSSTDNFASQATVLANCVTVFCAMGGPDGGTPVSYSTPGATAVRLLTICGSMSGCSTAATGGWPYAPGWTSMGDLQVDINDDSAPGLSSIRGAAWAEGNWHRGSQSIGFDASDNTGIQRLYAQIDSGPFPGDRRPGCDYSYAVPCSNASLDATVETASLDDGHHTVTVAAQDAAGNWNEARAGLDVDNHAPDNPTAVTVAGGESTWHNTNSFDISWTNPGGQMAPIARAHYVLYDSTGNAVASGNRGGSGITSISGLHVPSQGDYTVKVYLEDAAGNANSATASDPVHLKYDDLAPGQANPERRNGWVDAAHAADYIQKIKRPLSNGEIPVSGIRGYAYTTNGSMPAETVQVNADASAGYAAEAHLGDLQEGTVHFTARAISGAGVASNKIGVEDILVDLTAPRLTLDDDLGRTEWTREAVTLNATAADPGRLSGMAGAEASDGDAGSGGYLRYSIDGAEPQTVRGPVQPVDPNGIRAFEPVATAAIPVVTDGRHLVTVSATDVAGNESGEKTIAFKIDRTAPELVVFEAQDPDDPRLVNVAAADATSGLADGGKIQLRRLSDGDWITLRTSREGSRYYAHIDNAVLPDGDYEFRATAPDQAGNVATGDRNRQGEKQILHIDPTHVGPYRTGAELGHVEAADEGATVATRITVGVVHRAKGPARKCKKTRARTKRVCRKARTRGAVRLVRSTRIAFGQRAAVKGKVTASDGRPLAGVELTVLGRLSSDGARYAAERAIRTNRDGVFSYTAKAGPSRTLDFAYRGDSTYKHSDGYVTLKVPAAASIRTSRKRVRNGSSVVFIGKLPGKPYPTKGKVVDLQAFYRHKWRTFATARASRRGKWTFRYRFEATRGTVVYPFRVRVRASSDYAYELGYSKTVNVTVVSR